MSRIDRNIRDLAVGDGSMRELFELLQSQRDEAQPDTYFAALGGDEAAFASLCPVERSIFSGGLTVPSDRNFDAFFANRSSKTSVHHMRYLRHRQRPLDGASAVVAFCRNEGPYLVEWLAHHMLMGFDSIVVYSNDNTDGTDALLMAMDASGFIEYVDNQVAANVSPQIKGLFHATLFNRTLWGKEWVYVCDIDEYLILRDQSGSLCDVKTYFREWREAVSGASGVAFNWKWFAPDPEFDYVPGLTTERFISSRDDQHVKTITRFDDCAYLDVHSPRLYDACRLVNAAHEDFYTQGLSRYRTGQVNHYWSRSFEEFAFKRERGRATQGTGGEKRSMIDFFAWNRAKQPQPDMLAPSHLAALKQKMAEIRSCNGIGAIESSIVADFEQRIASNRANASMAYGEGLAEFCGPKLQRA